MLPNRNRKVNYATTTSPTKKSYSNEQGVFENPLRGILHRLSAPCCVSFA